MSGDDDDDRPRPDAANAGGGRFAELFGSDPRTRRIASKPRVSVEPARGKRKTPLESEAASAETATSEAEAAAMEFRGEVPPRPFTDLRMGRIRPETRIDLHGLDRLQAHQALIKAFGVARAEGRTCVLVIHGVGRHSPTGEATLKSALPSWLRTKPLAEQVRGFAPAIRRDGGEGATYVLLRKTKKKATPTRATRDRSGR